MIMHHVQLDNYNTFGIKSRARKLFTFDQTEELQEYIRSNDKSPGSVVVLGGGSNVLFTDELRTTVLHPANRTITVEEETPTEVTVRAGAGVVWDELVNFALDHGYHGIENLSMIPGHCGAAPIQNIGAYGTELCEVFEKLQAVDLNTGNTVIFTSPECEFGYRNSVFKTRARGQYCITDIYLKLSKLPRFNLEYGALQATLDEMGVATPDLWDVSKAVRHIRSSKLPDPGKTGNAGSFFKNPVIEKTFYESLQKRWPDMPCYKISETHVKVPAGWLIDKAGWKGFRYGKAGVHDKQALVLINLGDTTGKEVLELARKIREDIYQHYGIELQAEVNIWDRHGRHIEL